MSRQVLRVPAFFVVASLNAVAQAGNRLPIDSTFVLTEPASGERTGLDIAVVNVAGVPSMAPLGSASNFVMHVWIGPGNSLTGLGWNVVLQTLATGSRLSDMGIKFSDTVNSPSMGVGLEPAVFDEHPGGPTTYSSDGEIVKFQQYDIPSVHALADGLIRLEFFDFPDDAIGMADGYWVNGSLHLQTLFPIPVPSAPAIGLLITAGISAVTRRRRIETTF